MKSEKRLPMVKGKTSLGFLFFLFIVIFVEVGIATHFTYVTKNDNTPSIFSLSLIYHSFFVWYNNIYSGEPIIAGSLSSLFFNGLGLIMSKIIGQASAWAVLLWLELCACALGIYLIIGDALRAVRIKSNGIGEFAGALVITTPLVQNNFLGSVLFLPLTIYFLMKIVEEVETRKKFGIYHFFAITSMALLIGVGGSSAIVQNAVLLFILSLSVVLTSKMKLNLVKSLVVIIGLSLLINASWIVNPLFFTHDPYIELINATNVMPTGSLGNLALLTSEFSFSPLPVYLLRPDLFVSISIVLLVSIFSIATIFTYIKRGNKPSLRIIMSLFFVYLIFIALASPTVYPFNILKPLYALVPYLRVFTQPWEFIMYASLSMISIFYGIGVGKISNLGSASKVKPLFILIDTVLAVLPIIIFFLSLSSVNFNWGNIYHVYTTYGIPSYVLNASTYLNQEPGSIGIATIPVALGWQMTTWYTGVNVYTSFIYKHSVDTGGESAAAELIDPVSAGIYEEEVGLPLSQVDSSNEVMELGNTSLANAFGVFGIKYILFQKDAINNVSCFCYEYPFNLSFISSELNHSREIVYDARFGNATIYKNLNYVPLVYSARIVDADNAGLSEVYSKIMNNSFNGSDTVIYSSNITYTPPVSFKHEYILNATTITPSIIENNLPLTNYTVISPTKVLVHISNATGPYYLVFRESYDRGWIAFYQNGSVVATSNHILVNGFANAWYINKTGSYTITLYYAPQTLEWIAWIISFTALVVLGLVAYNGFKRRGL